MTPKILLTFIFICCINKASFSQAKSYNYILPKDIQANPILDSASYLPDSLRQPIFSFLKSKNFDLTKCFCDKRIWYNEKDNSITIRIWDIDDLIFKSNLEKLKKSVKFQSTHSGFYSGTLYYDFNTKSIKFYGDQ
jgi:hypothetical protein